MLQHKRKMKKKKKHSMTNWMTHVTKKNEYNMVIVTGNLYAKIGKETRLSKVPSKDTIHKKTNDKEHYCCRIASLPIDTVDHQGFQISMCPDYWGFIVHENLFTASQSSNLIIHINYFQLSACVSQFFLNS